MTERGREGENDEKQNKCGDLSGSLNRKSLSKCKQWQKSHTQKVDELDFLNKKPSEYV